MFLCIINRALCLVKDFIKVFVQIFIWLYQEVCFKYFQSVLAKANSFFVYLSPLVFFCEFQA